MFFEKGVISRRRNATFLSRGFEEVVCRGVWRSLGGALTKSPDEKKCVSPARELTFFAEAENSGAGLFRKL